MKLDRWIWRVGLAVVVSLGFAGLAPAQSFDHPYVTFTGDAAFVQTPYVLTTTEGDGAIVNPEFVDPEVDPARVVTTDTGFAVTGRLDFVNGSGSAVEIRYTVSRPLVAEGIIPFEAVADGNFGVEGSDNPPDGSAPATPARLDFFSVVSQVHPANALTPNPLAEALDLSDATIPLTQFDFADNNYHSLSGPNGSDFVSFGTAMVLEQDVTIDISGLTPGETVDIALPTGSYVIPPAVPEPSSLALALIAVAGLGLLARRRPRTNPESGARVACEDV